jgi:hypothetical protein
MFLITSDHGFHGGDHDYLTYSILGAIFLFCVFTFIVAGMQPNNALLTDTYSSPLRAQHGAAKRER